MTIDRTAIKLIFIKILFDDRIFVKQRSFIKLYDSSFIETERKKGAGGGDKVTEEVPLMKQVCHS